MRLTDENGIDLGQHATAANLPLRAPGPWDHNATVKQAQREADAPLVALVARHPDRFAFVDGKIVYLKAAR